MIADNSDLLIASMGDPAFVDAMRRGISAFERFRTGMPLAPQSYTRTLVERGPGFEVVAMLWAPGSRSPIHDHGTSRCWVVMLEGALDVDNFDRLDDCSTDRAILRAAGSTRVDTGELDHRLGNRELHRVANTLDRSAYSLQLYSEPLSSYATFDEASGQCRYADAKYDAFV